MANFLNRISNSDLGMERLMYHVVYKFCISFGSAQVSVLVNYQVGNRNVERLSSRVTQSVSSSLQVLDVSK